MEFGKSECKEQKYHAYQSQDKQNDAQPEEVYFYAKGLISGSISSFFADLFLGLLERAGIIKYTRSVELKDDLAFDEEDDMLEEVKSSSV